MSDIKKKGLSFTSAMLLFITVFVLHYIDLTFIGITGTKEGILVNIKTVIMIFIYIMSGLALRDYKGLEEMIEGVWDINKIDEPNQEHKLRLVKSYIEMKIHQWYNYWILFDIIVNENEKAVWNRKARIKDTLMRVPRGELNIKQFMWIVVYLIFNILQAQGYFPPFTLQYELPIDFTCLGLFMFTSGKVIGLNSYMKDMFKTIAPSDVNKAYDSLRLLEAQIKFGTLFGGLLKHVHEEK